jgi:hypothetical protein
MIRDYNEWIHFSLGQIKMEMTNFRSFFNPQIHNKFAFPSGRKMIRYERVIKLRSKSVAATPACRL